MYYYFNGGDSGVEGLAFRLIASHAQGWCCTSVFKKATTINCKRVGWVIERNR